MAELEVDAINFFKKLFGYSKEKVNNRKKSNFLNILKREMMK